MNNHCLLNMAVRREYDCKILAGQLLAWGQYEAAFHLQASSQLAMQAKVMPLILSPSFE